MKGSTHFKTSNPGPQVTRPRAREPLYRSAPISSYYWRVASYSTMLIHSSRLTPHTILTSNNVEISWFICSSYYNTLLLLLLLLLCNRPRIPSFTYILLANIN